MKKTEEKPQKKTKKYIKPEIKKHKSMAVVSGSGRCTYYLDSGDYYY